MTVSILNVTVSVSPVEYIALVRDMHNPDKKAATAATPWARTTLAMLIDALDQNPAAPEFTADSVVASVCAVYQPSTASGKRADTVGALRASGWAAMAKRITDIEFVMKNIGISGVSEVVADFINAPRKADTFASLNLAVKAAIKEAAPAPDASGEGVTDEAGELLPPLPTPLDIMANGITALMQAIAATDGFTLAGVADDLRNLSALIAIKLASLETAPIALAA